MNIKYGLKGESYKHEYVTGVMPEYDEAFQNTNIPIVVPRNSWADFQVLLSGDEEFDAAMNKLIDDIKKMGADECNNYHIKDFENAQKNLDEILKRFN